MKNWTGEWTMPPVSPTSDESAEYSSIMNDINTLISENVVKFITGQRPISEFDAFIDQIKSMNIDRAVEIQQAALDRYNNRVK
jgi:putative aldouronate transport system substrate-binding protein